MKNEVKKIINENLKITREFESQADVILTITRKILAAFRRNKKIIIFGNGGSAADAQHFAAELVVKFEKKRKSLNAIALTTNSSVITACGNDFGFDEIFARQLEPIAQAGDVVIGISTSGNSPNVVKALTVASRKKIFTVGFTGKDGGIIKEVADVTLKAPSDVTARIQECHILAIHIICKLVEKSLF